MLLGVGLLRLVRSVCSFAVLPPPQARFLHVGYPPKDFLASFPFIGQVPTDHTIFVSNRITPQH